MPTFFQLKLTSAFYSIELSSEELISKAAEINGVKEEIANLNIKLNDKLAELNLLNSTKSGLLPDYVATSGIIAEVDDNNVTLSRNDGSNMQSVMVPKNQNTTIYITQGVLDFKNRVNSGGTTTITLKQN